MLAGDRLALGMGARQQLVAGAVRCCPMLCRTVLPSQFAQNEQLLAYLQGLVILAGAHTQQALPVRPSRWPVLHAPATHTHWLKAEPGLLLRLLLLLPLPLPLYYVTLQLLAWPCLCAWTVW